MHQASDPAVLPKLRELHPPGAPVDFSKLPPLVDPCVNPDDVQWEELVQDAIRRFPRSSSGGP